MAVLKESLLSLVADTVNDWIAQKRFNENIKTLFLKLNDLASNQKDVEKFVSRYKITQVNSNYDINPSDRVIMCSMASAITLKLPTYTDLVMGDSFYIKDFTRNSSTYNITLNLNGNLIEGSSTDQVINTNGGKIELIYITGNEFIIK